MASIKLRGESYLIRASCGYDAHGKQVIKSMTWRPPKGMTPARARKEAERQAVLFEEKCKIEGTASGNVKFETFARQWFKEYAEQNLRIKTVVRLHELEERTYTAIGHIRIDKLTARQVQAFIDNLGEGGISTKGDRAEPRENILAILKEQGLTIKALADNSGISYKTARNICKGRSVSIAIANKVMLTLGNKKLFDIKKGGGRLAQNSIKPYLYFISAVMDYACRYEMVRANPCKRVIIPSGEKEEKGVYGLEEAQKFIESLDKAPVMYKAFFVLAIYGGFRRGELLGLEWKDIDFDNNTISIRRTSQYLSGIGTYTDDTKTEKSKRTLKLPVGVFSTLRQLWADQAQRRLLMGNLWEDHDRLFTGETGKPLQPNSPYRWLSGFCKKTRQRNLGIHAFRHLNASLLINSGADVKTVADSLGHSAPTTTLNIYAHTFEEAQARAGEAVADLLSKKAGF